MPTVLRGDWPEQLPPAPEALVKHAPDWDKVEKLFRAYELRSLLRELPNAPAAEAVPAAKPAPVPALTEEPDLFSWHPVAEKPAAKPVEGPADDAADDLFAGWTKP